MMDIEPQWQDLAPATRRRSAPASKSAFDGIYGFRAKLERLREGERSPTVASDPLARITSSLVQLNEARSEVDRAAMDARIAGHSWADIGRAAGMSRQAALARWGTPRKEVAINGGHAEAVRRNARVRSRDTDWIED